MKKTLCPNCFYESASTTYLCSNPGCEKRGAPLHADDAEMTDAGPMCPACGKDLTVRVCSQCGFELRDDAGSADPLPFSVVGVQGSGKSHYLAVLVDQIKHAMSNVYGCSLYPVDGDRTMEHYNHAYHRPLYELGRCIPSTQQADVLPLRYSLVFPGQKKEDAKSVGLSFYDACGKSFESEQAMMDGTRSVYHSRGILFFVDPTQFPVVRDRHRAMGLPVVEGDATDLMVRTLHLVRTGLGITNVERKIPIPMAVCVTKLDTVMDLLDPSSFLRGPSRHLDAPALDKADLSCCNHEVQSLLHSWEGSELIGHVKSQVQHACFFGFSALGASPSKELQVPRVSPHRVLDPLLWLLYRHSLIRAE